jgi:glutaredoxin
MERIITCQNSACRKSYKVSGPGKRSDYIDVPDIPADAVCPYCERANRITWPKGVKFITGQNV